jgi:iron complex transport system substrate-binding protein
MKRTTLVCFALAALMGVMAMLPACAAPAAPAAPTTPAASTPAKTTPAAATPAVTTPAKPAMRTVVDMAQRSVSIPVKPLRVATMQGPTYEMVFAMGGKNQIGLVRDDHKTAYPLATLTNPDLKNVQDIKNVGPQTPVNIEEFIKFNPDLVIYWNLPQEIKKFETAGIPSVIINWSNTEPKTIAEANSDQILKLKTLADILGGNSPSIYQTWAKYFTEKNAFIQSRTSTLSDAQKPTVYWGNSWGINILATWGASSTNNYTVDMCGGIFKGVKGPGQYPEVTREQLLGWAPQVIIVDNHGRDPEIVIEKLKTSPEYASLPAVKNNRIYRIPAGVFFMDKGTSSPVYNLWLAKQLHPDLFKDVDLVKETKYYFTTFYSYNLTDAEAQKVLDGWVLQQAYQTK